MGGGGAIVMKKNNDWQNTSCFYKFFESEVFCSQFALQKKKSYISFKALCMLNHLKI